jgi:hypothetical protein
MRCSTGAGRLAVLVWACPFAGIALSSVSIDHAQVGCVVASGYPQFEARFDPSAEVARARLYFRASNTPNWYYVEMAPQAAAWRGTILKPRPDLERIDYYIEVTDRSFGLARTAEYAPRVARSKGECGPDDLLATLLPRAEVVVKGVAAAAPALPAGFAAQGLVSTVAGAAVVGAAAGGVSAAVIAGGVAVAGGAAAVIATTGGSDEPTTTTSTQPPSLTGHWVGTAPDGLVVLRTIPGLPNCNYQGDVQLDFVQSGTTLSGSGTGVLRVVSGGGPGCEHQDEPFPIVVLAGSTDGTNVSLTMRLGPRPEDLPFDFRGTVAGTRMSGTLSTTNQGPDGLETFSGTWALVRR